MKIISWNVNGLRSVERKGFFEWLKKENPDIICLQEVKVSERDLTFDLLYPAGFLSYFNCADKKGYSGVCIYSKQKPIAVNKLLGLKQFDNEGRFLELKFEDFTLVNLYIPHGGRDKSKLEYKLEVYSYLTSYLRNLVTRKLVVCGDFNIAHEEVDLARPKENINNIMFTFPERMQIKKLLDSGFVDSFRKFEKGGGNYTWWPYMYDAYKNNIGWRIDYFLVSKNMESKLKNAFILKEIRISDHCPIGIELK